MQIDMTARTATLTVHAPVDLGGHDLQTILDQGAAWWPLAMARDLNDAILFLRTNCPEAGTWLIKTRGSPDHVIACDRAMLEHVDHWFVRKTTGYLRKTLARLEICSRSIFAIVDEGSCFVGTLFETALAADRIYQMSSPDTPASGPVVVLSGMNFGQLPMVTGQSRLARRFCDNEALLAPLRGCVGEKLCAEKALDLGLVTVAPDELDWSDEIRLAIEERTAMSPDALIGLEANLRFNGRENLVTRIFGRLSAWQNWIFQRPSAVGERGALKAYGTGQSPQFDLERV